MSVVLRFRKLKDGRKSVYLDIHHNGVRIKRWLKITLTKGKGYHQKEEIKEKLFIAEKLRLEAERDCISSEHGIDLSPEKKKNVSFTAFYLDYIENTLLADKRTYVSALNKLKAFAGKETIHPFEITEEYLERFKKYLNSHLFGETPYNYFKKVCKVLKEATKAKLFKVNPAQNIVNKKLKGSQKDVLSIPEIKALANASCPNSSVKRAFLLSCYTGLRFCDVISLKWKNIDGEFIDLVQRKTKVSVRIPLKEDSKKLLGARGPKEELIFRLPSHTGCNKALKKWVQNAGIEKHITWHCGRHSFGTNLIELDINLATASSLLGHTSLKETMRYVRLKDELRHDAISKYSEALKTV